jgi:iron complex outermembrane recepter protein
MKNYLPKRSSIAAALMVLFGSAQAATELDEIVVSASRSEQTTFDAPAAIQSLGRETIESAGPQVNLSEPLTRVPGVTILNRQNYAQDLQLSIRGFGARTAFGIRGVRLIVDGIPASMPDGQGQASTISLSSTERIEVLRGPLAQLYGNASGGVVQAFTREAPETPEFTAHGYAGSYDTTRGIVQYAGRLGDYGLVADYGEFRSDGFRQNSKTVRKHFNGKLGFENGRTKVHFVANLFDMPLAQDPGGLASNSPTDPTAAANGFSANRVRKTVEQNQLGAVLEHRTETGITAVARIYGGQRDVFQAQFIQGSSRWIGVDRDYWGAGLQISQNLNLGSTPMRLSYGFDYDLADEYRSGGNAVVGEISDVSRRQQDYLSYNGDFFVQSEIFLTKATTLIAGARRSNVTLDVEDRLFPGSSGKVKYSATNPVLGLSHLVSETLNIYANTGRGFESPSIAETSYTGAPPTATFNSALQAAKSRHYEVGLKYRPGKARVVDLAAYRIDTENEITTLANVGGNVSYANAAKTRRDGIEVSYLERLGKHFQLYAALNHINAVYSADFQSGADTIQDGNRIPGIPQRFAFIEAVWNQRGFLQPQERARTGQGLTLAAEIISAGKLYANDLNTRVADGYNITNLRISHTHKTLKGLIQADLRFNNVFDKNHIGSVIVASATPYEPAPGRNWLASVKYSHQF